MLGILPGLVAAAQCDKYYIDLGTNIGSQVHKLYDASCGGAVQSIYKKHFGDDRRDVCTIGFEPNPKHSKILDLAERRYVASGIHVRFIKSAASTEDGTAMLNMNEDDKQGEQHHYWAAGLSKTGQYNVTTVNVAGILNALPTSAKIVMKMDVEGHETKLLPQLVEAGVLCRVAEMYIETHGGEANAALEAAQKTLKKKGCGTLLTWMDDESSCAEPAFIQPKPHDKDGGRKLSSQHGHRSNGRLRASLTQLSEALSRAESELSAAP